MVIITSEKKFLDLVGLEYVIQKEDFYIKTTVNKAILESFRGIELERIEISSPPAKTNYSMGESFDAAGMVVTAMYSNGKQLDVTGYSVEPSGILPENASNVVITYSEGGISASAAVPITVSYIPKKPLNEMTWAEIRLISDMGLGKEYFNLGDQKQILLNGTIGTLNVNMTIGVYILDFDHNADIEGHGIQFGMFCDMSDGTDVCLVDSFYNTNAGIDGKKSFALNHWGITDEPYNTNYGGWKGCDSRYDILGSTNRPPSGYGSMATPDRVGYDPEDYDIVNNPVPNTLMAALPADLRAVMKPITKYTDNVGNQVNTLSCVTSSIDYLPLLSPFEVSGDVNASNRCETLYQKFYRYYVDETHWKKYRYDDDNTVIWGLRSPVKYSSTFFLQISSEGKSNIGYSRGSFGICPIFMV